MQSTPIRTDTENDVSGHKDFSDVVQGEDYEIRQSVEAIFPVKHKIQALGDYKPPTVMSKLSANQLVMIAGASSGFLAGVAVCPLDVAKTRAQAQGAFGNQKTQIMRGYVDTFRTIVRDEGFKGLYRGVVPITVGYLPTWMIYFTAYERAKDFYGHFLKENFGINATGVSHFFSAITAGSASSIAVNPIWVVKTRLMIQRGNHQAASPNGTYYTGTIDAFRKMYRQEGLRVFYSGLVPSLFGLLHVGIHFPVYEYLKEVLGCNNKDPHRMASEGTLLKLIFSSTVSKTTASTITYPHEILRTRLQVQDVSSENPRKKQPLKQIIQTIYAKEGLRGFYAGYGINLVRTLPASAVTLVSFEYFKTYLLEINGYA
ncbi:hypothetical protein PSN45_002316 [Yamadazyma tenuis]|uniref:Mitochondrial thiamine pyrophosphate carrier 1 n=1 Tax=Candida tenuis (strain ATCC 10573 / BCRC 21748 / CBS 615 / JCM 9827 / NBRC 10315 / NRRL Y-1498 / VKM Y-70) TaxID=590646 RepID=G3BEX6_CANTC|nr:mitochondrial carrier [Yamadazyma tenuis ATCC 10573]EGV59961.1 mitochondrial carrier [Yamadazyma tenuis ATCC 10573]WEJ94816.1 hypothetical protein PSN45_002316 [Yamadazyma tenuis]